MLKQSKNRFFSGLALLLLAFPFLSFEKWEKPSQPPNFSELTSVLQHPTDPRKILVSSAREILERNERGMWTRLWFPKSSQILHRLIQPDAYPHKLIALTESGAYEYVSETKNWKTLFERHHRDAYSVFAFAILPGDPDHLFVGTKSGLFESFDGGKIWYPFPDFAHDPIHLLHCSDQFLYVGTDRKLFRSNNLTNFKEIFSMGAKTGETLSENSSEDPSENLLTSEASNAEPAIYDLVLNSSFEQESLWLATSQGVFESRDDGKSWIRLSLRGLKSAWVSHLVYSKPAQKLWAGTKRGVYEFDAKKSIWKEISLGLENPNIWALTLMRGNPDKLLALTPSGFSQWPILPDSVVPVHISEIGSRAKETFQNLITHEPTLREVHRRVIADSGTSNWKTKRWHLESRLKPLLPDVSFSKDFSRSPSIDIDRGGTSDADKYILGPEDRNRGWDFGVSWSLGEFIWSSAQTSIDSREKMMVELRRDLLAEASRVYFERRRLEMEILFAPAATEQEHYEKLLHLEELTALLDGMTGGWYGRQIEKMQSKYPEMEELREYPRSTESKKSTADGVQRR